MSSELFEILEERMNPSDIIELMNDYTKDDLEDYAIKNMVCPRCGYELRVNTWFEERSEFQGRPVNEEMSELVCDECGRTY
jgi:uncharacterized protein with PIN domain